MKKILIIISLLVGVNGFAQTQDTVKTEVFNFKETLHNAYHDGYEMYDVWFYTLADVWGVNYNMIHWYFNEGDYDNMTFQFIIYQYFEYESDGGRIVKNIQMNPKEADEYFKSKKK